MKNIFCHIVYIINIPMVFLNLMVHNILQSDLHGFKASVSSNLTIIFVPPNVTTIILKQFQHKLNYF